MPLDTETLGLAIAATAAALWAVSSMIWGLAGATFKPVVLNCLKGLAACVLFAITLLVMGEPVVQPIFDVPGWQLLLLGLSGIVGIAIGDTFYFGSLNRIGPRQASLLSLLAAPMVAVLGWWLLEETLSPTALTGITLTVIGVAWVVLEKKRPPRAGREVAKGVAGHATTKLAIAVGVLFGVLAAVGQAVGAIMNRAALVDGEASDLWTALWRVGLATVVLMPVMAVVGVKRPGGSPMRTRPQTLPAIFGE
ncbi:MAG: DMT family transporter, partial [Planctomycetota bacterium]